MVISGVTESFCFVLLGRLATRGSFCTLLKIFFLFSLVSSGCLALTISGSREKSLTDCELTICLSSGEASGK